MTTQAPPTTPFQAIKEEGSRSHSSSSGSDATMTEDVQARGRKQERENGSEVKAEAQSDDDSKGATPGKLERKRKRSRKGLDKKYLCPQEGCGKSYSRAEHLYRHQLNHTPKQWYHCDYPDCSRTFVRQDLCARHRERHTTRGSHLQRKDNYIVHTNQSANAVQGNVPTNISAPRVQGNNLRVNTGPYPQPSYDLSSTATRSPATDQIGPLRSADQVNAGDNFRSAAGFHSPPSANTYGSLSGLHRSNSDGQYFGDTGVGVADSHHPRNSSVSYSSQRHTSFSSADSIRFQKPTGNGMHVAETSGNSDNPMQWSTPTRIQNTGMSSNIAPSNGYNGFVSQQNFPPISSLPPPIFPQIAQNGPFQSQQYYTNSGDLMAGRGLPSEDMIGVVTTDSPHTDHSLVGFDTDGYARSPVVIAGDFTAWLFNDPQYSEASGSRPQDGTSLDPSLGRLPFSGTMPTIPIPPQSSMAVNSLLEPPTRTAVMSEAKRREIIELIDKRFNETNHSPVAAQKEQLLAGDRNSIRHSLSLHSFQTYIGSYWYHFHDQMPILHRPTFSADKAPNLLLVAVLAIGAANLDKIHGEAATNAGAELANFLAWHLRGELFMDRDFRPPAKLWVLQTLILLECYEKLYSSRLLHERSQIHHGTTISLLRRGSALLGRSAMDSPPSGDAEKHSIADTSDHWWNHWITNEATKRVAYALFILDSIHATMFSHTAVMLAHELRLPLPCDEALWTANNGMEVGRLESSLREAGIKQVSFLDGLKGTLNSQPVRTNRYGRTAIMAGLLNVTFHLGQRDLQVRSLGVIGGRDVWRGSLTRAFDVWETDWDKEPLATSSPTNRHVRDASSSSYSSVDDEHVFESRVVLHHLAHMGMHVDIVQCQIYAKAKKLLGRTITPTDYKNTVNRMPNWANKVSARDAVFYSLKFLGQVLTPDLIPGIGVQRPPPFRAGAGEYSPRDDYLLNRPWVVYFAALVVWSYGYALDGSLTTVPPLETKEDQMKDMRAYMKRIGGVEKPDDLVEMKNRNSCAGLLCFLGSQFKKCRWELMHEASILLGNCVDMLKGV